VLLQNAFARHMAASAFGAWHGDAVYYVIIGISVANYSCWIMGVVVASTAA
jgi:hypothetical protein